MACKKGPWLPHTPMVSKQCVGLVLFILCKHVWLFRKHACMCTFTAARGCPAGEGQQALVVTVLVI